MGRLGKSCLFLAAVVLLVPGAVYVTEWVEADRCLDRGGSFDYVAGACHLDAQMPFVPFVQRHGVLLVVCVVAAAILSVTAIAVRAKLRGDAAR